MNPEGRGVPEPGRWFVVLDAFRLPRNSTKFVVNYFIINPKFGSLQPVPQSSKLIPNGSVWTQQLIAAPLGIVPRGYSLVALPQVDATETFTGVRLDDVFPPKQRDADTPHLRKNETGVYEPVWLGETRVNDNAPGQYRR